METDFKLVLKDSEQSNVPEDMKEGTHRPKREPAELVKVWMCYISGINLNGGHC